VDTRDKILSSCEDLALLGGAGIVVTGHFDPLLAAHAVRLRELAAEGQPLVVVITEPAVPLLPARARAEMVAGLAMVDHVIVATDASGVPASWQVYHEEEADSARTSNLIRHVHLRQSAG